jgi:NodT family efflux transporter outer membrane factor (OMF) lipoprotein
MKICCLAVLTKYASLFFTLPVMLFSAGCVTVGPDYVLPDKQAPAAWHAPLKSGLVSVEDNPGTPALWWTSLNDQALTNLISRVVAGNLDLKKARARIREARAKRGLSSAGLFPVLDANGSTVRNRSSESAGTGETVVLYNAGFDASWELDIFGGIRRSVEAAEADLGASKEDLHDVLVSLIGEVAQNYIEMRTYQARLTAMEENARALTETLQLASWRFEAGLIDALAVQQAAYNLENVRSQIPSLHTGLEGTMNRIATLLGEKPGAVHGELEKPGRIPSVPLKIAVGVPADALRRRPDVRRTERELAAQTARVGVAVSDLYPKFTLSGSIGLESLSLNKLFLLSNKTVSAAAGITQPIFHGGAIRNNIEIQSALQEQAAIKYEATLLSALEEIENVLVAYVEEQNKRDALYVAEAAARKAAELSQYKFEAGLADFISVLDAQRSHLTFQDQLAQSNGAVIINLVKLYKALGGGWESLSPDEKK